MVTEEEPKTKKCHCNLDEVTWRRVKSLGPLMDKNLAETIEYLIKKALPEAEKRWR